MELIQLDPGVKVERWQIERKLGEGGFGAVYRVKDIREDVKALLADRNFALKVEATDEKLQVLRMEVTVLTELGKRGGRHFCKIEDKGRVGSFNYVVMTLVGKSLQDLRKESPAGHMSMGTALSVGIQTLEALEDLHSIGYLHRDVKPPNYTVGRAELGELRKVYVLDFGMCRKFTNEQGVMRRPRSTAGFRGTVRYAPIACHVSRELCRKDDVESWLYMQVELTTGEIPWKSITEMNWVGEFKKRARDPPFSNELFAGCPREYPQIMTIVDNCTFFETPNYDQIYKLLRQAIVNLGVEEYPYDWE